jgi:type VI secretion system protein ImpL
VRAEAAQLPMPLRSMLENLADSSSRQTDGSIRSTLGGELDSSLGEFCRRAIQGRYPFERSATQEVTLADFARMFGQGGMMDAFFQSRLAPMADVSGATWVLRQPGGSQVSLSSFQKAARIRDVFFPSGGKAMDLSFEFKVLEMDATIEQMTLDVDGQVFRYAHGPQVPQRATWPGPRATNQVRIVTASAKDGEKYMVKTGPWALFRLFDEGEIRPGAGPERFVAALLIHGKRIVLEVTASSVQNPFRLRELVSFSCPGRI